jgi:anhydro-N-acetylmuramic acid kinase
MTREFRALGLMSGTSGDGVDASIIQSDGETKYNVIYDDFYEYNSEIYDGIHSLKEKINSLSDLKLKSREIISLEKEITLFHAKAIKENIMSRYNDIDLIGFHGQTIYHNIKDKISKQIGDGRLLSQLLNKTTIYHFRENDINNNGAGAPLSPIFHKILAQQNKIDLPLCILNIGGISNITIIKNKNYDIFKSLDIGPGNCLIDEWIRKNSEFKFDKDGLIATKGIRNEIIIEQAQELYLNRSDKEKLSLDTKDFDISFVRGLNLADGTTTLTDFTAKIISSALISFSNIFKNADLKVLVCGGGRKNNYLINAIKKNVSTKCIIQLIDEYGIDGDYVESQAFAYLAIRSYLNLPISFPETTGCSRPSTGGKIIEKLN